MTIFTSKKTTTCFSLQPEKKIYKESKICYLEPLNAVRRVVSDQMWRGKEKSEGNEINERWKKEGRKQFIRIRT